MKTGIKNSITAIGFMGIFIGFPAITFAGYFNNSVSYGCTSQITRTLQTGSENDDVYSLQEMLYQNGYLYANPNGYFGPATRSAVISFQRDNGLYTTGTVGEATIDAINAQLCGSNTYAVNNSYNYSSGTTVVDTYDPYVKNITSTVVTNTMVAPSYSYGTAGSNYSTYNPVTPTVIIPATTNPSFVYGTNIVYSPNIGYTYGLIPQPGTLTISSPGVDSHYNEGDTVNMTWTTNNINNVSQYQILLENSSGQSKLVTTTSGNSASFVITKDILDYLCVSSCAPNYAQGSYKIVVTTPLTDLAGNTSIFRAAVSPIFIKRPYSFYGNVIISGSKNPVSSGELFKLYINAPVDSYNNYYDPSIYGQYSIRIHAICPSNVQVTVAGVPCGQEFSMPFTAYNIQQEIPAMITNNTYYKQDVVFVVNITNPLGQVVGTSQTTITGNAMPFSW